MGGILFVLSNALAAGIAALAADMAMRGRERWRAVLAAVAGFPVVVIMAQLLLGLVGVLTAGAATVLLGVAAAGVGVAWRRSTRRADPAAEERPDDTSAPAGPPLWLVLALVAAAAWWAMADPLCHGIRYDWDDLWYHATAPAHWRADGRLSLAPVFYTAHYALNSELFSLWFLLPFRGDALVGLAGFYWAVLAVVSTVSFGLAQGRSRSAALAPAALILAAPVLRAQAETFSAVDLAGPACVLAAVALALPSGGPWSLRRRLADACYSGVLAGMAVGCKVSFAPAALVVVLWLLLVQRRQCSLRARAGLAGLFVASALMAGGFWYARNFVLTGNPLFPAEIGPFHGPLAAAVQDRTKLITWVHKALGDSGGLGKLLALHTRWPWPLFAVAVVGYVAGVCSVFRRRAGGDPARRSARLLLLLVGLAMVVSYPFVPLSGSIDHPRAVLRVQLRYLIVQFAVGVTLVASLLEGPRWRRWGLFALAGAAAVSAWPTQVHWYVAGAVGVLGLLVLPKLRRISLRPAAVRAAALGVGAAVLVALAALAPLKQRLNDRWLHTWGDGSRPIGDGWRAVNALPEGSRIAFFGPVAYQYYPLFGRQLQLEPYAPAADGSPYPRLADLWRKDPENTVWWWGQPRPTSCDRLVENLLANGVDFVFVTQWDRHDWPPQQQALATSGQADAVYDDGYSVIWKLKEREGSK